MGAIQFDITFTFTECERRQTVNGARYQYVGTYDVDSPDVQSTRPATALTCCGGGQRLPGRRGKTNDGCRLPDLPATPPDSSSGEFPLCYVKRT